MIVSFLQLLTVQMCCTLFTILSVIFRVLLKIKLGMCKCMGTKYLRHPPCFHMLLNVLTYWFQLSFVDVWCELQMNRFFAVLVPNVSWIVFAPLVMCFASVIEKIMCLVDVDFFGLSSHSCRQFLVCLKL